MAGYEPIERTGMKSRRHMVRIYARAYQSLREADPESPSYAAVVCACRALEEHLILAGCEDDVNRLYAMEVLPGGRPARRPSHHRTAGAHLQLIEKSSA